jgi:hypothetical protein
MKAEKPADHRFLPAYADSGRDLPTPWTHGQAAKSRVEMDARTDDFGSWTRLIVEISL